MAKSFYQTVTDPADDCSTASLAAIKLTYDSIVRPSGYHLIAEPGVGASVDMQISFEDTSAPSCPVTCGLVVSSSYLAADWLRVKLDATANTDVK